MKYPKTRLGIKEMHAMLRRKQGKTPTAVYVTPDYYVALPDGGAHAQELECSLLAIYAKGVIKVGVYNKRVPFSYLLEDLTGDLCKA